MMLGLMEKGTYYSFLSAARTRGGEAGFTMPQLAIILELNQGMGDDQVWPVPSNSLWVYFGRDLLSHCRTQPEVYVYDAAQFVHDAEQYMRI
jgi:hypothetical protein